MGKQNGQIDKETAKTVEPLNTSLRSLLTGGNDATKRSRAAVEAIREDYPTVADILGGVQASGGQPEILPGTITFFVRDGVLRFSINVKSALTTLIGDMDPAEHPFRAIEFSLISGRVSSKEYTERMPSLPKHPDSDIVF